MVSIYCGDDTVSSRRQFSQALSTLRTQGTPCIIAPDVESAIRELQSVSLFQENQVVALENALSRKPQRDALIKVIKESPTTSDLYIWEGALDPKSIKRYFPQARIFTSALPTNMWKFLDALMPGNLKTCMRYKAQLDESVDEHMLLFMMQRRCKDLLALEMKVVGKRKVAPWQASQLLIQGRKWGDSSQNRIQNLSKIYHKLYDIEVGTKTGTLSFSIQKALDISLCFYLQ